MKERLGNIWREKLKVWIGVGAVGARESSLDWQISRLAFRHMASGYSNELIRNDGIAYFIGGFGARRDVSEQWEEIFVLRNELAQGAL